ncbi:MAG: hypothetical protein VB098_01830 [Petrimonas sp.]|nr:hypothetical protein [Petrimonas sp.]
MKVFNHETLFDTANRTMTFLIHPRLQIVVNFAEYEIIIIKDGKIIDRENCKGEHFSIDDLELVLTQANEAAEKLKKV